MAGRGVKIRVLTNALEATDVPAVHAGYANGARPF
jgi:cardiolipin synthase C